MWCRSAHAERAPPAFSPAWAHLTVSQPQPVSAACPAEPQGNQGRLPAPPSPAGSFPLPASQRGAAAAGPLKQKDTYSTVVTAPGQQPDQLTTFSVSGHELESLPGTAAVEGMTPLLFIHSVGTITLCLYRKRTFGATLGLCLDLSRLPHPLSRYSSLGIMQPNTVEKFSVGQRLGLDLADWGRSKVSLFAG